MAPRTSAYGRRYAGLAGLALLLMGAFWLRWRYARDVSLYVDEFTTLWAARRVQALGAPLMPSGVLYTRGLLASYVEAAFLALFGFSYLVGRLPSILFSLATLLALWRMGRQRWQGSVGWLAAVGLALLPEAIVWGARARFYAQLQCFVLLVVWAALLTVDSAADTTEDSQQSLARRHVVFALLFILALFSHEETVLLYPALLLGVWLWRGWRFFLQRPVWLTHGLCLVALGLRYALEKVGQPGYFETIQAQRPYVGLILDLPGAWATYSPLFVAPERLLWTLGLVIALAVAGWQLVRVQGQLLRLPRAEQATLFVALQFFFVVAVVFALVGTSWREARYLFFVQPFWLLLGAAGIDWLLMRLPRRSLQWGGLALVTLVAIWPLWPQAQAVLHQQVEGYDQALAYVAAQRQAGDVVLSPQPPACALVVGGCDYYAIQWGYEEFVISRGGKLVDRWSGAALLNSTAQLATVIRQAPRTWFITDSFRLATRYDAAFIQTVVDQYTLAFAAQGVMVLQTQGWRTVPPLQSTQMLTPALHFGPLALVGYQWRGAAQLPDLPVTLQWQSTTPVGAQINTSLRLVNQAGEMLDRVDGPPANGLIPTTLIFDQPIPDPKVLTLPATAPPALYRLELLAYDAATVTPLTEPQPVAWFNTATVAPPAVARTVAWNDGVTLVGSDALPASLPPGATFVLRLVWTAQAQPHHDYTVFVHLVDQNGATVAQNDRAPVAGFYPTHGWLPGVMVEDHYELRLPDNLAAGAYAVVVGLYQPETGVRLTQSDGADSLLLGEVQVR
ncbi:MAG: glycosyltransferase family 39 protein [Caldilineaceae bacterium]